MGWEANLSQEVKPLLNLSSIKSDPGKPRKSLRLFNKDIAQVILTKMKERSGKKESEMMTELLESAIFEQESLKKLRIIIYNVIKKREFIEDGRTKNKFSNFVIYVRDNESGEVAVKILEQLFKLNRDPFTAQLISRFYIDLKNWSKAEYFAYRATNMLPGNSYLWDTYGQVFKNQLFDQVTPDGIRDENLHVLIELTEKCIEIFRKEQEVSEHETTTYGDNNFAGYFGELGAIVLLLSTLKLCPSFCQEGTLHRFLVDENYKPDNLYFLKEEEITYIKNLGKCSKEAMRRLDEEYLQMKGNFNLTDLVGVSADFNQKTLLYLKSNLDEYFGEVSDDVPKNLSQADIMEFTRRRVKKLGGSSLYSMLTLRKQGQIDVIKKIYSLIIKNIKSNNYSFEDLKILLDTVTVLLIDNNMPKDLKFEKVLDWCMQLYRMNRPPETDRWYLETFLYFVLYNFPTEERQGFNICMSRDLSSAMEKWQEAFNKNFPKFGKEEIKLKRRETTLFFLGNGPPLHDIVHQDSLEEMENYTLTQKWDLPEVRQKLCPKSGTLMDPGDKVRLSVTTKEGNKFFLSIQTSHRVTKRDMWLKTVHFYVGFSFSGPRAFGMSREPLGLEPKAYEPRIRPPMSTHSSRGKEDNIPYLTALYPEVQRLKEQITKNPRRKNELEKKLQQIYSDIKKVIGEPTDV